MTTDTAEVDLRCPERWERKGHPFPGQLLAKLRLAGLGPSFIHPENLVELPCDDCRYHMRKEGRAVRRVLHRYDLSGVCVETLVQDEPESVPRA